MIQSSPAINVIWNLFLAVIPVALAYVSLWVSSLRRAPALRMVVMAVLVFVWLLFLPNTCYLLTEWRHYLDAVDSGNLFLRAQADHLLLVQLCGWSLFYFLYSGFGMVTFALAIRPMEHLAVRSGVRTSFWALPFFVMMSLGVYLGLVLRFNSWDSASRPEIIWWSVVEVGGHPRLVAFIIAFGIFLWISYKVVDIWFDGLLERWYRLTGSRVHLGPKMD